jgi:hypothetical protein
MDHFTEADSETPGNGALLVSAAHFGAESLRLGDEYMFSLVTRMLNSLNKKTC